MTSFPYPLTLHMAFHRSLFPETDGLLQKFLLEWGQKAGDDRFQVHRLAKERKRQDRAYRAVQSNL